VGVDSDARIDNGRAIDAGIAVSTTTSTRRQHAHATIFAFDIRAQRVLGDRVLAFMAGGADGAHASALVFVWLGCINSRVSP
jgi:hypothetical protein